MRFLEHLMAKYEAGEKRRHDLLEKLAITQTFQFGGPFRLRNGKDSDFYANIRTQGYGGPLGDLLVATVAVQLFHLIWLERIEFTALAPVPRAATAFGVRIATAWYVAYGHMPTLVRFEKNGDQIASTENLVDLQGHNRVLVVENVTTTGGSCGRVTELLRAHSAETVVTDVLTILDREEGAREYLARRNVRLHALFTRSEVDELRCTHPKLFPK